MYVCSQSSASVTDERTYVNRVGMDGLSWMGKVD